MNMINIRHFLVVSVAALALCEAAPSELRFIPATPENTTLVDGSPMNTKEGEGDWKWLPGEGNQGIFESYGDPKKNAPGLLITAKDLEAGRDYEVFGFFWTHGFGAAPTSRDKQPHHWPASFGTGLATLTTYGGRLSQDIPWIICPESKTGLHFGYTAVLEEKNPLVKDVPNWITSVDDTRLIRARLGISRADKQGALPVYADDFPDSKFCGRTRIDGIGLRLMPVGDHESVGAGNPGFLHLAVRAGDTRNMRRELAAGADVNGLDEDGVTALLYPASSGDQATVHELLKAGTNPNQPGQSIRPLTGAASWGDAEMVKLLLDAGADVPDKLEAKSALLDENLERARLHPAITAIRAGSLGCLKLILQKNPDLNLEALTKDSGLRSISVGEESYTLVGETMHLRHDELVTFLINRGCKIDDPDLLTKCISMGDDMKNTREALLRHGASAISPVPYNYQTRESANEYMVTPWDGLSAAVFMGDAVLTKRLLPLAKSVDVRYQQSLHALADWSGKPEIIAAVRDRFPYHPVKAAKSRLDQDAMEGGEAVRLFLPRTGTRIAREKTSGGIWTLAVIPSPEAAGPATAVEVRAANGKQWTVVDRAEIEAALKEGHHAKPWDNGEHRFSELGDRITADVILLVTCAEGEGIKLLRFEVVDVASGLSVHREYMEEKAFEKEIDPMLARMHAAIDRANAGDKPLAISLLTFTADGNLPFSKSRASQLRAAMEIEVDGTPGVLTLSMKEIQSIAREQALKGEGSFWAAAYTLEGGVAALPNGRIALTLRLGKLGGKTVQNTDARVEGELTEIPALASRAWRQLMEAGAIQSSSTPQAKPGHSQAAQEAARLTRESEWLLYCGKPREAKPLVERAALLGAIPEKIVPMIFLTLVAGLPLDAYMPLEKNFSYSLKTNYPLALPYQQGLIDHLESLRELMGQTALLHERYGKLCYKWERKSSDFWYVLNLLSYVRAATPTQLLTQQQSEEFNSFCSDLDLFCSSYFNNLIQENPESPENRSVRPFNPFIDTAVSMIMLERNPELLNGMLKTYFHARDLPLGTLLAGYHDIKADQFAQKLAAAMESFSPSQRDSLNEQLDFARSTRDHVSECIRKNRENRLKRGRLSCASFPARSFLDEFRYGLFRYFRYTEDGFPSRKNVILHAMFHEPEICPESIVRSGYDCNDSCRNYSSLIKIETSQNPKQGWELKEKWRLVYLRKEMKTKIQDTEWSSRMDDRIGALASHDLLFGTNTSGTIAQEWQQMSHPEPEKESLKPRILVDLRQGGQSPGIFDLSVADSSSTKRLWLRYHPYENGFCLCDAQPILGITKKLESSLMAIDCTTGTIEKRINISGFKDLIDESHPHRLSLLGATSLFIAQNSSTLFTAVEHLSSQSPLESYGGHALIDKETGKVRTFVKNVDIVRLGDFSGHQAACVEVFNDEYFLLINKERPDEYNAKNDLVRMDSNGKFFPITQVGRKPELTPFDAVDRTPTTMTPMDGELLIVSEKDHLARYNPRSQSWTMQGGSEDSKQNTIMSAMRKAYDEKKKHAWNVKLPDEKSFMLIKGDLSQFRRVSYPGRIVADLPAKKNKEIPLGLSVPDDYKNQASFTDNGFFPNAGENPKKPLVYDDLLRAKRLHPVVLNQTDSDLIIGLRIQSLDSMSLLHCDETFLPFLWTLPKSEVFRYLGISDSK